MPYIELQNDKKYFQTVKYLLETPKVSAVAAIKKWRKETLFYKNILSHLYFSKGSKVDYTWDRDTKTDRGLLYWHLTY